MEKKGRAYTSFGILFSVVLVLLMFFVVANFSADPELRFIDEDTDTTINITITNSNVTEILNITKIDIELPSGTVFGIESNLSTNAEAVFSNSTAELACVNGVGCNVLTWEIDNLVANLTNQTFTFNVSAAAPAWYELYITATNSDGTFASSYWLIVNDTTKPTPVIAIHPLNATLATLNGTTIYFNVSATDNVNISTCYYSLDGATNRSMSRLNDSLFYASNATMSQGAHGVIYSCNDTSNNWNYTLARNFGYDSMGPALIAFTNLTNFGNNYHNASIVTINITNSTDVAAGKIWLFNNTANITYVPYANLTLADGNYTFIIYANDSLDNMNYSASRVFMVDTGVPNISFASPLNTSIFNDSNIFINISTADLDPNKYVWWSNSTTNTTYTAATSIVLTNGNYTLWTYVNDSVNHRNQTNKAIQIIDITAPGQTIVSPTEGATYTDNLVGLNVSSTANDTQTWWYSLNGGANTTFSPNDTVSSIEGDNTVYIYVNDSTGNIRTSSLITFTIAATSVSDDTSGSGSSSGSATYTLTDANLLNGLPLVIAKTSQIKFSIDGNTHYVKYTAYNINEKVITVTVSSTPQTANITEGGEEKFDVDGDGYYDIKVKFEKFYGTAAKIIVTKINEAVALVSSQEDSVDENVTAADGVPAGASGVSLRGMILWTIVIAAVIVIAIVIFLTTKKSRYARKGY